MPREFINPDAISRPTGYTHVVKTGNLVFIAGQIAANPNGEIVGAGDFEAQAQQVFANLDAAVRAAGGTKADIVATTVYMLDRDHLPTFRRVREQFFGSRPPASTLLFITGLARPELLLEVEATAVIGD